MAGPIKISVLADVGQAVKSVTHFSEVVDSETKRVVTTLGDSKMEGKFGKIQEGFDVADTRAMGFRDTITGVQDSMTALQGFMGKGESASKSFGDKLLQLGMGVGDLASGFANFVVPLAAAIPAMRDMGIFTKIQAAAQWAWNAALEANPIMIIVLAIIALIAIIVIAYKNNEKFREIVQAVWAAIKAAVSAVVDWITENVPKLWDKIRPVWEAIKAGAVAAWNWIKQTVSDFVTAVKKWIDDHRTQIEATWNAIKTTAQTLWNAIKVIINTVVTIVSAQWNAFKVVAETVWNGVKAVITTVVTVATAQWNTFKNTVTAIWNAIKSAATTAWNGISGAIKAVIDKVTGFVNGLKTAVSNAFKGAASLLVNAGRDVIQGFWNGLIDKWNAVKSWFSGITKSIPSLKGPASKDAKLLEENGQLVIQGFLGGLESQYGAVQESLAGFTDSLTTSAAVSGSIDATTGGVSSSAGRNQPMVTLEFASTGDKVMDAIFEEMRKRVRAKGGNVQVVLGR